MHRCKWLYSYFTCAIAGCSVQGAADSELAQMKSGHQSSIEVSLSKLAGMEPGIKPEIDMNNIVHNHPRFQRTT